MSLANGMPYLRRKSSWNHPTPGTLPWLALHRRILGGWLNSRSMESPNLENSWDISNGPNLFCSKSSTTSFTKIGYSKSHDVSNIRLKSRMFWASWYPPFFETPICFFWIFSIWFPSPNQSDKNHQLGGMNCHKSPAFWCENQECWREDLEPISKRRLAVLDPLEVVPCCWRRHGNRGGKLPFFGGNVYGKFVDHSCSCDSFGNLEGFLRFCWRNQDLVDELGVIHTESKYGDLIGSRQQCWGFRTDTKGIRESYPKIWYLGLSKNMIYWGNVMVDSIVLGSNVTWVDLLIVFCGT